jgi:hypothetical protein
MTGMIWGYPYFRKPSFFEYRKLKIITAINMECNRIEVNKHCMKDFIYVSSIGNSGGITHIPETFSLGVSENGIHQRNVGVPYFQTSSHGT